jgi:hypothetical protein
MEFEEQPTIFIRRVGRMFGFENFGFDNLSCLYYAAVLQYLRKGY